MHRAHRRAVAQVGDDDAALRRCRVFCQQLVADRFIGQAVKAVAADALLVQRLRQREALVDLRLRAVESGVETGDLRHGREGRARGLHPRQVVRLVQRRQRLQRRHRGEDGVVDQHRPGKGRAPMHDAVAHGHHRRAADARQHLLQGLRVRQARGAKALDLARQQRRRQIAVARKQRELDRRRAGVEGEQVQT